MLVKLSGKSGVLQMFDVRGITTITVIIPFSHHGQGAGVGGSYTTQLVPLCLTTATGTLEGLRLKDRSLWSDTPYSNLP